jgi:hypothetical protein
MAFTFLADPHAFQRPGAFVARLGTVDGKAALMDALARALELPDWFGRNWDALDEVLGDLSWITEREVALVHEELPHLGAGLPTYLTILSDAVAAWQGSDDPHRFSVIFPQRSHLEIARALAAE